MAYEYRVKGPVQVQTPQGVQLRYDVFESDVSAADEFMISGLPLIFTITYYKAAIADDNAGAVSTLDPVLGNEAGFLLDTMREVSQNDPAAALIINDQTLRGTLNASGPYREGNLFGRNTPNAAGGSISTVIILTHGHIS